MGFGSYPVAAATAELSLHLEEGLDAIRPGRDVDDRTLEAVRKFYASRKFQPLWIGERGVNKEARALAETLADAAEDGLDPQDYRAAEIAEAMHRGDAAERADLEFSLTLALLRYGADLSAGRVAPAEVDPEHYVYPEPVSTETLLREASGGNIRAYLSGLAPQSSEYRRLKAALAAYRAIVASGGWGTVDDGETLKPGMRGPRIAQLRRRLTGSGDIAVEAAEPGLYDSALAYAVKHFQYRHGLSADGAVGRNTLAALNVPAKARVEQILLNMERRRWMPDEPGESYIFVNLADFVLKLVDGPRTILDLRVVVGKPYHRTPVFSDMMRYIVINPYWTVPPSIARNEILPKLRQDPDYLVTRNIKLFASWQASAPELDSRSIDWANVTRGRFPYRLRQEPGDENALGHLKFMFPNRFDIYLHDTPSRNLFERTVRSFSHGCIRVEKPVLLAATLLRDAKGWSQTEIEAMIATRERTIVNLPEPLPMHISYLTAWVNKDGSVHFRNDIYGRDELLRQALTRR